MPSAILLFAVGAGGFFGAISRYLASHIILQQFGDDFPYGTLFVNVVGSLVFGSLAGFWMGHPFTQEARLFLTTGFLGAFTTFSTFSYGSILLIQEELWLKAGLSISANVLISILMCGVGYKLMRLMS